MMSKATTLLLALAGALSALTVSTAARAQDAAAGKTKAAMCIGCHGIVGYQASFPVVYKVPMIVARTASTWSARWWPTKRANASTRRCAPWPRH